MTPQVEEEDKEERIGRFEDKIARHNPNVGSKLDEHADAVLQPSRPPPHHA